MINLQDYDCIYDAKKYQEQLKRFRKKFIPKNVGKNKICNIYMGTPGSGKSTFSKKFKDFINLDGDKFIDNVPEMIALLKKGIHHGNVIESCSNIGLVILDDIFKESIKKGYNIGFHLIFGISEEDLKLLKKYKYKIHSYFIYSPNSWNNNKNREGLNINKEEYKKILEDMINDINDIIKTMKVSDEALILESKKGEFIDIPYKNKELKKIIEEIIEETYEKVP